MKKALPFVIGAAVLGLLIVLVVASGATRPPKRFDHRISLRQRDKIPYGVRVAYELLPSIFPDAAIKTEKTAPAFWDSADLSGRRQVVILTANKFEADREELATLADFVERGNYVFIIAYSASLDATSFFNLASFNIDYSSSGAGGASDSVLVRLDSAAFWRNAFYVYPGYRYNGTIAVKESTQAAVLGRNENGRINFIQMNKGSGSFFLHSAPLAFSNYFILHNNNVAYYEAALSVLPKDVRTVVWNEYYLQKRAEENEPNWLGALFSYPSFKWGLLLAAGTLVLYLLLGMRRRQRKIPPHEKPVNDSLDFVKTLGRLYYDGRDHKNLAQKMATYFLDHIRNRYRLPVHTLDEAFVRALHFKSGYSEGELEKIVHTIQYLQTVPFIPENELVAFHKQLEAFYQNTSDGRTSDF